MQLAPISVHDKRDIKHVGRPRHQLISNSIAAIDLCRANRAPTSKPLDGRLSWKDDISVQTRSPHIRHMTPLNRHQSTSCRCTINLIPLLHLIQRTITLHAPLLPHDAQFYLHLYTPDVFEAEIAVGYDVVEGFFEVHAGDSAVVEDAVVDADAAVAGHPDGAGVDDVGVYAVVDDVFAVWGVGGFAAEAVGGFVDLGVGGGEGCEGEEGEVGGWTHGVGRPEGGFWVLGGKEGGTGDVVQ